MQHEGILLEHQSLAHIATWRELVDHRKPADFDAIKKGYRRAALQHHPDKGGSHEAFVDAFEAFQHEHVLNNDDIYNFILNFCVTCTDIAS
jgi:hypothetical protein